MKIRGEGECTNRIRGLYIHTFDDAASRTTIKPDAWLELIHAVGVVDLLRVCRSRARYQVREKKRESTCAASVFERERQTLVGRQGES